MPRTLPSSGIFIKVFGGIGIGIGIGLWSGLSWGQAPLPVEFSKFELAATRLGFDGHHYEGNTAKIEQEAFLKILWMAGYLRPEQVWRDLNGIGGVSKPVESFEGIYKALKVSGADSARLDQFHPDILRSRLTSEHLSDKDFADWMLRAIQNAFGRQAGQERNELSAQDWMTQYRTEYMREATTLGMIDPVFPKYAEYDEAWIAGASRPGLFARIVDFRNAIFGKYKIHGPTLVLAGQRPLWANIDGIDPEMLEAISGTQDMNSTTVFLVVRESAERTSEGRKYLASLARERGILLDTDSPFIIYEQGKAPAGYFAGRTYPNYAKGETRKLTESTMAEDLLEQQHLSAQVVDTAKNGVQRPNTATTAKDAAERMLSNIHPKSGQYHVLFETNQPYIDRQTLATQGVVDGVLKERGLWDSGVRIIVDGVGFGCKQDVATVHSELAAKVSEQWKARGGSSRKFEDLAYQTREHGVIPAYPAEVVQWDAELLGSAQD
jgi:hypothetical protein